MYSVLGESPIMNSGEVSALAQITGSHTGLHSSPVISRKLFVRTFWWFSQDVNRQAAVAVCVLFPISEPHGCLPKPIWKECCVPCPPFFMGYRKNMIVLEYISKIIQRPDVPAQLF